MVKTDGIFLILAIIYLDNNFEQPRLEGFRIFGEFIASVG